MILRLLVLLIYSRCALCGLTRCLTGYMTDVQDWVRADGTLKQPNGLDLSGKRDAVRMLYQMFNRSRPSDAPVTTLSLSRCGLSTVPEVFLVKDQQDRTLADSLRRLSLYGNDFGHSNQRPQQHHSARLNASGAVIVKEDISWEQGLRTCRFNNLRELDLRSCNITTLRNGTFVNMPSLTALYLGENPILNIESHAFIGTRNLVHLDISNIDYYSNGLLNTLTIDPHVFKQLSQLKSLDLSNTKLKQMNAVILKNLPKQIEKLSICNSDITALGNDFFKNLKLKYLDVSGNTQILSIDNEKFIENLKNTLTVLYAERTGLQTLNSFAKFNKLEIMKLRNNAISSIEVSVISGWTNLRILDLTSNRIPSWFGPTYSYLPNLQYLSLIKNNLNMISEAMIGDLMDVAYIGLSDNYFVCSCHVREFIESTIKTERLLMEPLGNWPVKNKSFHFHSGYKDYTEIIMERVPAVAACDRHECTGSHYNTSYLLFDYNSQAYGCYTVNEDAHKSFMEVKHCEDKDRIKSYDDVMRNQTVLVILITCIPLSVFVVIAVVLFRRWWCVKYFFITVKNSAMLSIINNEEESIPNNNIYHYDVFVSYCNDDRPWVLDELLPHVERDCNVSVCLHERDFQVGLSILENIVSCMDRSRSILLVISNKFLLSQWCQFEMHLAQHRLLETRREDLILVLLEDIPRRRRPNTLHYLMMTKTYIVWPEGTRERGQFWRRVRKSLASGSPVREAVTEA